MLTMGLYAVDLLAVLMTILTSVDTLSGEIASGTIQAVATKPVPRWQVLVGKWFGSVGMLTAYIAIMVGGVECRNLHYGGSDSTSPHTRLLVDVDGKPSAAFGNFCFCHLFFDINERSARARPSWTRFPWRMD